MNYNYRSERPDEVETFGAKRVFNFDIEEVEQEEGGVQYRYLSAEGNIFQWDYSHLVSSIIRAKYSADDIEAIMLNDDADELSELQQWRDHAKYLASDLFGINKTLDGARGEMLRKIAAYDKSPAVNGFSINGIAGWIDRDTRTSLANTVSIEVTSGKEMTTLWFGDHSLTLPCEAVLQMLGALEMYAHECYNVTAQHKYNVSRLADIDAILGYDYKEGYPAQPVF